MKLTDKQKKMLWIAGAVLVAIHYAPSIVSSVRERREAFRAALRANVSLILTRAFPDCSQPKAQAMTAVVLHILKGLATITPEKLAETPLLRAEFRDLLCLYLGSRVARAPSG